MIVDLPHVEYHSIKNMESLKVIFEKNKRHLLYQIKKYLSNKNEIRKEKINKNRSYVIECIKQGKIHQAIIFLEDLRERKSRIFVHKVFTPHFPSVFIRDARNCCPKIIRNTEGFEIQYLNLIRSSLDIIDIECKANLYPNIIENALKFINYFHYQNIYKSQEEIRHNFQAHLDNLVSFLENEGIKETLRKLNVSKDFQNFNDIHGDVVTITSLKDENKNYMIFEAEVALRGLTTKQIQEYNNIFEPDDRKPEWYKSMPTWEQELCKKYSHDIIRGRHVISSQLRQIIGMRNAFEKITGIVDFDSAKNLKLRILHKSKHAGCLASFSRYEGSRQYIANLNAEQAQEWIGSNTIVHCNTFNSGPNIGTEGDKIIVNQTIKAMQHIKGRITNTAYDSFRKFSGANFYQGVIFLINSLLKSLDSVNQLEHIISHIKYQNKNTEITIDNKIKKQLKNLCSRNIICEKIYRILNLLIDIKNHIEKSKNGSPNFSNLEISMNLNIIQNIINNINMQNKINKYEFSREEILNMCALGLDRTGFSEHIQSIKSIENIISSNVNYLDINIITSGHTSQLAGATYFGGGSIGCYGIKSDSSVYFPKKRLKSLSLLLELSASGNNLEAIHAMYVSVKG